MIGRRPVLPAAAVADHPADPEYVIGGHLRENVAGAGLVLSTDDVAELDRITAPACI